MKIGDWVKVKPDLVVADAPRRYGRVVAYREKASHVTLQFPIQIQGQPFEGPRGQAPMEAEILALSCNEVEEVEQRMQGCGPSVAGSPFCRSNSLASGGNSAYCTCDGCF
jgi:hypothetical protein